MLNYCKKFSEDLHSAFVVEAKVQVKQGVFDEFIDQQYFEMSLLLLFFQNFNNLNVAALIIAKDFVMLQIFETFGVEPLIFDQFIKHFAEDGVIGPEHHPQVDVAVHLIEKDGVRGGVGVEEADGLDEVALPLAVAELEAGHEFGEVVAVDAVVVEDAVDQRHQPHPALLKVIKRAVEVQDAVLDLLRHRVHRVDVQRQPAQLLVHLLHRQDAVLRRQLLQRRVRHRFQHADLLVRRLHRISKYLKSLKFIILLDQMERRPTPTEERARCLALQRVRARLIKDTFLKEGSIDRQDYVAKQVFKYSTLLSEKMLHKLKTEELREFAKDVEDYCRASEKEELRREREREKEVKEVSVSQLLSEYKNSTKIRLLQINKKRTKTSQSHELSIEPGRLVTPEPSPESKVQSPLGNKRIREAIEQNKKKMTPASRFRVNGRGVNSQIIQLIEKMEEVESIEKLRKRRELMNDEEEDYLEGRSNHLKKEKERLSTAFEHLERSKFKPIGRVKKDHRANPDRMDFKIQELDYLKKLHNRTSKGMMLEPLKRSAIIVSSNYIGKASIHLEEGLPQSIRNQIPSKNNKKSQGEISINDSEKHGVILENITPTLLRPTNLFITNDFA